MSTLGALRAIVKKHVITIGVNPLPVSPPGFIAAAEKIMGDPALAKVMETGLNNGLSIMEIVKSMPGFVRWVVAESIIKAADPAERMSDGFADQVQELIADLSPTDLYDVFDGIRKIWFPDEADAKKKFKPILDALGIKFEKKVETTPEQAAPTGTSSS